MWQAGSVFWNTPINIQAFTTNFQFQLSNAQGNGFTFTIQNVGRTALGGDSAGLGYQNILKSVAIKFNFYNYQGEGSDSTGLYTNGQPPVLPTIDISPSGIKLGSGDSIQAQVIYTGSALTLKLLDLVTNKTFTKSWAINISQIVGANTAYVGFTGGTGGLSSSQKLISWTYSNQAVPPAFSPGAGSYSTAQTVALSTKTTNAVIYYTTNGSAPTAASTVYTKPVPVVIWKLPASSFHLWASQIMCGGGSCSRGEAFPNSNVLICQSPNFQNSISFSDSGSAISLPFVATANLTLTRSLLLSVQ